MASESNALAAQKDENNDDAAFRPMLNRYYSTRPDPNCANGGNLSQGVGQ